MAPGHGRTDMIMIIMMIMIGKIVVSIV